MGYSHLKWIKMWSHYSNGFRMYLFVQYLMAKCMQVKKNFFSPYRYPAASALKYDRLFREAAVRSKSTLQWDVLKADILVWCVTRNPFCARQQVQSGSSTPRQGSATTAANASNQQGDRSVLTTTGQEICRCFIYGKCTKGAECHYAHKCYPPVPPVIIFLSRLRDKKKKQAGFLSRKRERNITTGGLFNTGDSYPTVSSHTTRDNIAVAPA